MPEPAEPVREEVFDRAALKHRSSRGAVATFTAQGIKFVLKFGSTVVMARLLTPGEFGIVAMAAPILGFVTALNNMGFAQAIIRHRDLSDAQVSSLFWLNLLASSILALVILAASPVVGMIYREPEVTPVLAALSSLFILSTASMIPSALMSRQMRFLSLTAIDLSGMVITIVSTIAAAWAGMSYWSLVLGQLLGAAATAAMSYAATGWRPQTPRFVSGTAELARFGANLTGVNVAGYLSMTADNIIVGAVGGKVALGLYDRSYSLVVAPLAQLIAPLNRVALPLLARLREDSALYRKTYIQMLQFTLLLTLPTMIFCTTMARPFILFLWGARWEAAIPLFFWFCVGGLVAPVFSTTGWLYAAEGRTGRQLALASITAGISIASFIVGVIWGGAKGVVMTNAFTFTFIQVPLMAWGATKNGIVTKGDFARALTPLVFPSVITAAVLYGLSKVVSGWWTVPTLGLSFGLFGTALLALPQGRTLLRTIWGLLLAMRRRASPAVEPDLDRF